MLIILMFNSPCREVASNFPTHSPTPLLCENIEKFLRNGII
ncbi:MULTISPECIES: hypothetical protein [unclassified Okeania]|nr:MULTISPECIES: hypothetical protein [unclassified Okeania]